MKNYRSSLVDILMKGLCIKDYRVLTLMTGLTVRLQYIEANKVF